MHVQGADTSAFWSVPLGQAKQAQVSAVQMASCDVALR